MNLALSPRDLDAAPPARSHVEAYRLGMPHLALGGLSETWLLKELGHRHWLLLAAMAGREVPDFRDDRGAAVYAAFRAVSIEDAELGCFAEHDTLVVESTIRRLSRTQFASRHRLERNGTFAGTVELCSIFVTRRTPGRNRSIARIALDAFGPVGIDSVPCRTMDLAGAIGRGTWRDHMGFANTVGAPVHRSSFNPSPGQDFNGADFLYFACFQGFVDRAEWEHLGRDAIGLATAGRDIVYHGNIELGDRIAVDCRALRHITDGIAHWHHISREGDGAPLADVFTARRRP